MFLVLGLTWLHRVRNSFSPELARAVPITKELIVQAALHTEQQFYTEKTASNILYNSTIWILLPETSLSNSVVNLSSVDGLYSHHCAKYSAWVVSLLVHKVEWWGRSRFSYCLRISLRKQWQLRIFPPLKHPRCCASYIFCLYHPIIQMVQWKNVATSYYRPTIYKHTHFSGVHKYTTLTSLLSDPISGPGFPSVLWHK